MRPSGAMETLPLERGIGVGMLHEEPGRLRSVFTHPLVCGPAVPRGAPRFFYSIPAAAAVTKNLPSG